MEEEDERRWERGSERERFEGNTKVCRKSKRKVKRKLKPQRKQMKKGKKRKKEGTRGQKQSQCADVKGSMAKTGQAHDKRQPP